MEENFHSFHNYNITFEGLKAVRIRIKFFLGVVPSSYGDRNSRFTKASCLQLQGIRIDKYSTLVFSGVSLLL